MNESFILQTNQQWDRFNSPSKRSNAPTSKTVEKNFENWKILEILKINFDFLMGGLGENGNEKFCKKKNSKDLDNLTSKNLKISTFSINDSYSLRFMKAQVTARTVAALGILYINASSPKLPEPTYFPTSFSLPSSLATVIENVPLQNKTKQ
ncbi:hypothetical protein DERP_000618 [Dermatophagoides pteronyssinus]|uniref:Uncharacterized protein n=1 Tax=Dermatophagoides pteronyssinus TaxID=6956 RepID=A0ABQ8J0P6_DERPT|nr:hypothetical protein DERP_000618 [Dermatophagoides pteronyssinus]